MFYISGSEYNVGRIPMASCDFSPRVYSYDDTPGDLDLKDFKLQDEDFKYKVWIGKDAGIVLK
jgi:glucosylceramidase